MKKFDLKKSFHHGGGLIHAGIYRVPKDMTEELATKAQRDGLGEWRAEEPVKQADDNRARQGRSRKSLGGAPENKAQGGPATSATFPGASEAPKLG